MWATLEALLIHTSCIPINQYNRGSLAHQIPYSESQIISLPNTKPNQLCFWRCQKCRFQDTRSHFLLFVDLIGILARNIPSDLADLSAHSIDPITIVVCNLYPFTQTISRPGGCTLPEAVEEVDIGGVTLLRAAAKNHARVYVLSDPKDYDEFLSVWTSTQQGGEKDQAFRNKLALKAFEMTAEYDQAISGYFREQYASAGTSGVAEVQRMALRYGANPHQKPAQAFVTSGELPFKGAHNSKFISLNRQLLTDEFSPCRFPWLH